MSSEEICEALVRHVETTDSEAFEKNFVKDGRIVCTVFCVVGSSAEHFRDMAVTWLTRNGLTQDN